MENIRDCYIKRIEDNAVWTKLDEAVMIIATVESQEKVLNLNKTAAFLWESSDGKIPVGTLIEQMCQKYDVNSETAFNDAVVFIEDMKKRGLITVSATVV
jgi:hypothetical protein